MHRRTGGENPPARQRHSDRSSALPGGTGEAALRRQPRRPPAASDGGFSGESGAAAHVLYASAQAPSGGKADRSFPAPHGAGGIVPLRLHRRDGLSGAKAPGGGADGTHLQSVPAGAGGAYLRLSAAHSPGRKHQACRPARPELSGAGKSGKAESAGIYKLYGAIDQPRSRPAV